MEGIIGMKNTGLTFIEVLIVAIIIGILAVMFLPNMQDPIERSRSRGAVFNLETIYNAQKRYLLDQRQYFFSSDLESINQNLSVKIEDSDENGIKLFAYNITPWGSGYIATAVRASGKCKDAKMTIVHNNSTVNKTGCQSW
jgi:Tfp pilus assembly protein PilE